MLHRDVKSPGHLGLKNQATLYLCWNQSRRYFNVMMGLSLKMM